MTGGLGICNERELDGRKVHYLRESNEARLFSEAATSNPRVGMESSFPNFIFLFWCAGTFPSFSIIQSQEKFDLMSFYFTRSIIIIPLL